MNLSRRSFIKKSSYSAAAVTILGTGVALAENQSDMKNVTITETWDIPEKVIHSQDHPYTPTEQTQVETSQQNYPLPQPTVPEGVERETTKGDVPNDYLSNPSMRYDPDPVLMKYRAVKDADGNPTGDYEAYIPAHKIVKDWNWGAAAPAK